jgi:phosphate starvation-inducible PhoH-like protein
MAKKNRVAARRHDDNVEPLFHGPIDPHGEDRREQSYLSRVRPRTPNQKALLVAMREHCLTIALGPAGTGKTYLAVSQAVEDLRKGRVSKILLSRPAIEAGESLGYLPGDMNEKMDPYMRPLFDALRDRLDPKSLRKYLMDGTIEISPVGFQRGRTYNNAFVLLDEAQNCTYTQLKMFVTRLGANATLVLTGDPEQTDLPQGQSGLADLARRLEALDGVAIVRLGEGDIVRHPLVADMLKVL